jgi:hypothetical protein
MKKNQKHSDTLKQNSGPFAGAKKSVKIAGRSYPIVRGSIRMTAEEAGKFNLSEFPSGSIVDFTQDGRPGLRMHALQNITPEEADVVILYRLALDNTSMPLSLRTCGELMKQLMIERQDQKKDLVFLADEIDDSHLMVSASVKAHGRTVDDVFDGAKRVMEEVNRPLRRLISEVQKQSMRSRKRK